MKHSLIPITLIMLFSACSKKVTYSGVVYSRHHIGVPNQKITFGLGYGGKDLDESYAEAKTDASGAFVCHTTIRHNGFLNSISIDGDSGYYDSKSSATKSISNMELVLQ